MREKPRNGIKSSSANVLIDGASVAVSCWEPSAHNRGASAICPPTPSHLPFRRATCPVPVSAASSLFPLLASPAVSPLACLSARDLAQPLLLLYSVLPFDRSLSRCCMLGALSPTCKYAPTCLRSVATLMHDAHALNGLKQKFGSRCRWFKRILVTQARAVILGS